MEKEYIKGLRKARDICLKYAHRTQDYWVENELVKELDNLIKELKTKTKK